MKTKKLTFLEENFVVLDTIGDGSCFLHAILQSFSKKYRKMNKKDKINMVMEIRHNLSNVLLEVNPDTNKTYYQSLSRGEIEEISQFVDQMKLDHMKNYIKSRKWINFTFLEFISDQFDIDIYIFNDRDNTIYYTGDPDLYYKGRDSVLVNYIDDCHFESIGMLHNKKLYTFFSKDSEIIKKLKNHVMEKSKK